MGIGSQTDPWTMDIGAAIEPVVRLSAQLEGIQTYVGGSEGGGKNHGLSLFALVAT